MNMRIKFMGSTLLLFFAVLAAVASAVALQQREALTHEVLARGQAVAENLAAASQDFLRDNDTLSGMALARGAVERKKDGVLPLEDHRLGEPSNWGRGLVEACGELLDELPSLLERSLDRVLGRKLGLGWVRPLSRAAGSGNEGIAQVVIVDAQGQVAADDQGTTAVGSPYTPPAIIQAAGEDAPFPLYALGAQAGQESGGRRLYLLKKDVVLKVPGGGDRNLGTVYVGEDRDLVDAVVFKSTMKLAAMGLAASLFGALGTYFLITLMIAPVGRLAAGVLAIAGGDFDARVRVSSRDELGELSSAFNAMAVSLSQNEVLKAAFKRYVSGAALDQILADPGKTGLHSKRVLATIYTSDVRGFTAMSETLEPEQVVQVINTYLSLQTDIILKHGGVVDKFIGDATIGVWGKEAPGPDDALNAVRAALEVQAAIDSMNERRAAAGDIVKLIGIGVNTGEVVSGDMGSTQKMEYTVTGEHVNFADQICAECPGGKVWISESTYQRVKGRVTVEPAQLKGKGKETGVWLVLGLA
jgi:class 3 adenylate cyclase